MADGTLLFKTALDDTGIISGLKSIGTVTKTAFGVAAKATAAVTGALTAGATAGVLYNSSIENYTTSFEVMTGSADKAVEVVEELKKIGASTPFELTGLADTTQLLMNYGFTADEAINRMTMLGDISQGNADKLTRIATAYGQMSSAGKVQLEDIKQMIEAGFNPLQEISQTTGETMESLYDRISKGTISVDEITASMQRSTSEGGKYFQSMEKQSQTFTGQISTLKDNAQMLLGEVVQPISDSMVNTLIPAAISSIDELAAAFQQHGVEGLIQSAGTMMAEFVTAAAEFAPQMVSLAVQLIGALIQGIMDNLPQLVSAAGEIANAILEGIGDLCPALEPVTDALRYAIENIEDFIPAIASVVGSFAAFKIALGISGIISGVAGAIGALSSAYAAAALKQEGLTVAQWLFNTAIAANPVGIIIAAIVALAGAIVYLWNTNDDFRDGITQTWNDIKKTAQPVIEKMVERLNALWNEVLKPLVDFFMNILGPVIEGVFASIGAAVEGFLGILEGVIDFVTGVFSGDWERVWQGVKEVFGGIWDVLTSTFQGVWTTIEGLFGDVIASVITWFSELPEKVMYWLGYLLTSIAMWGLSLMQWAVTAIPEFINNVVTFFSELPGKIGEWLTNTIQNIAAWCGEMAAKATEAGTQFISNVIASIKQLPEKTATWLKNTIAKVLTFISDMKTKATEAGKGFFDNITTALSSLPEKMMEIGSNIVSGIWKGISAGWDWLITSVKNLATSLFKGAQDALDIHSPSRKFKWLGEMCVEGLDEPLEDYNPYDTLKKSMNPGVITPALAVGGHGISTVAAGVRNTADNIKTATSQARESGWTFDYERLGEIIVDGLSGVSVMMEAKPVGRLVAPYVNDEIGRISERRT